MAADAAGRHTEVMTNAPHTPAGSPGSGGGPGGGAQLDRFFDWIRSSGIYRGDDRWFAGVCGGIARRTGLDPMIVRGAAIVLAILGGPMLFAYAVGWAFLPNADGRIHAEQLFRGVFEPAMVAIIALFVITVVPFTRGLWWQGPPVGWDMPDWLRTTLAVGWALALAGGIVWLIVFLLRRVPAPPSAPTPPTGYGSAGYGSAAYGSSAYPAASPSVPPAPSGEEFPNPIDGQTDAAATATSPGVAPAATEQRSSWDAWQKQNREWQRQSRKWRQKQQAERTSWRNSRHPGAGYSAIVLGLALATGAVAAATYSKGVWSSAALVTGLAFCLGVLALGIIVSGIRGRDSGAVGGFAFVAALGLVFIGVFPQGTQFMPFGDAHWDVGRSSSGSNSGYAMVAGRTTVDLSTLDAAGARGGARTIDVWLGAGSTELVLPEDRPVRIESNALIGGVDYGGDDSADRGGILLHESQVFNSGSGNSARTIPLIRVWSFVGQVDIVDSTR
jgi:phage shock protein PspC (stress-responsive transcriptional regulator)